MSIRSGGLFWLQIHCSNSKPRRGFGANETKTNKATSSGSTDDDNDKGLVSQHQQRGFATKHSRPVSTQAPCVSYQVGGKSKKNSLDIDFEERLKAIRRSALEQKKAKKEKEFGAIDYDAPISSDKKTIGLDTKIGGGVAVVAFGLIFAFGDFLPSGSVSSNEDNAVISSKLSEKDKATLQSRLKKFEVTLSNSPRDPTALEGAAVTLAELGDYARAASLLDDLTKETPNDADVFRLLGEVKYELKDYEGSVAAYKSSAMVSEDINFEVLRGLTNSLLAARKPDEAVQFLLACREHLSSENFGNKPENSPTDSQKLDPVQVDLLLGKAYLDWGHINDALALYNQLISTHPDDFRGYLAKGIILKENNNIGDAERMFIQARFFAPDKAKALVDRYSRQ